MKYLFLSILSLFTPSLAFAQASSVQGMIDTVSDLIRSAIPIAGSLAVLVFFFGIARFILAGGDEKNIAAGKRFMFWGIVGLFVLVSVLGIINLLQLIFFGGPIVWDIPLNPNP